MPGADTPALPTRPCAMLPVLTEGVAGPAADPDLEPQGQVITADSAACSPLHQPRLSLAFLLASYHPLLG